jgi:RNA polymerase II-associated protein 1
MLRGQRFELDLDDNDDSNQPSTTSLPGAFIADVLERKTSAPLPPKPPALKNATGFPEHRKRNFESRFKQQSAVKGNVHDARDVNPPNVLTNRSHATQHVESGKAMTWEEEEKQRIDRENDQKLAQMSPLEIEEERKELMNSLSPALLRRLLQRSNIDSGSEETDLSVAVPSDEQPSKTTKSSKPKTVSFAEHSKANDDAEPASHVLDQAAHKEEDSNATHNNDESEHDSVHFPQPQQPPDLDPTSETFLQDLHEKYFPSLPSDPDKLEWMQTSKSSNSGYDPSAADLKPKDLRFNFKGELIPPRTASEIPVTAGLHHHGEAPEAAGYTITELVHLGHSSFAPQRCIAFQTLGRLLYRLGKGEFGDSGEPGMETVGAQETFGELARGLWREVEREKAIEMLVMESEGKGVDGGKHVSAKSYATEAVWLWQKSGGRRWKAG